MLPEVHSLFTVRNREGREVISALLAGSQFRLEQIVSFGAASAPGFWYDQEWSEWAALIRGRAVLEFEAGLLELGAGRHVESGVRD